MRATSRTFKPNLIVKYVDIGGWLKMKVKIAASEYKKLKGMI
jgi:ribosomal protein L28